MRDHSHHIELSRDEAVSQMLALLQGTDFGTRAPEQVALASAYGRTLAADVCAKADVPSVLTCCMDSIAVHFDAFEGLAPGELPDTSDWVRGRIVCHQTNHGPGHHSSYAVVDGVPVVGISGPPAGASFTLNFYLKPLMLAFRGLDPHPRRIPARLGRRRAPKTGAVAPIALPVRTAMLISPAPSSRPC